MRTLLLCGLAGSLLGTAWASDTLYSLTDADLDQNYGGAVCSLGDVDGDGRPDFAIGDHDLASNHFNGVHIVSGGTGGTIHKLTNTLVARKYGEALASLPDIDGDGLLDLVVGAPIYAPLAGSLDPQVDILSSATGATLLTVFMDDPSNSARVTWAEAVAGIGDLDGDSVSDVLVGAISDDGLVPFSNAGAVYAHSGADGSLIWKLDGGNSGGALGEALAVLGDLNADGIDDFAVGESGINSVLIVSGADAKQLGSIKGPAGSSWFGSALAPIADLDADGVVDLVVGDYFRSGKKGAVYVYSLASVLNGLPAVELHNQIGLISGTAFGRSVASCGDVDADGSSDYVVGSNHEGSAGGPGEIEVFSGANGASLLHVDGPPPGPFGTRFGQAVTVPGDVNADGAADIVVGDLSRKEVHVISTGGPWDNLGQGLAGTSGVPQFFGHGPLSASSAFAWHLKDARPGGPVWLVLGVSLLQAPFKGGTLVPSPDLIVSLPPADAEGHLHVSGSMPATAVSGVPLYFQAWVGDAAAPAGFAGSNGLSGTTP